MDLIIPPRIPEEAIERVQQVSIDAFIASDCEGMARADCFYSSDGEVLVNRAEHDPGFTATSVYAKLFGSGLVEVARPADPARARAARASRQARVLARAHLVDLGVRPGQDLGDPDDEVARLRPAQREGGAIADGPGVRHDFLERASR